MKKTILILMAVLLLISLNGFADDVLIDSDGNVSTGVSAGGNLTVIGGSGEYGIVGVTSGTGAVGVYGENTSDNYGNLGGENYGVFGYSLGGWAGYFLGNVNITGDLNVGGTFNVTETDPQVGTLVNGQWCTSDGTQVNCDQSPPVLTEADPTVNDLGKAVLLCSSGEIVKWSGTEWVCANDNDTNYSAGTGLNLNGSSFNVNVPLTLTGADDGNAIIRGTNTGTSYAIYGNNSGSSNWGALASGSYGVYGFNAGSGVGIYGRSMSGNGVYGYSQGNNNIGILGTSGMGVYGSSGGGIGGYFTSSSGYGLIVENGNVGIGTTTPTTKLQVNATSSQGIASTTLGGYIAVSGYAPSSIGVAGSSNTSIGINGESITGTGVRGYASSGGVGGYFDSVGGYGLIVENGNVGIGTTAPGAKLEIGNGGDLLFRASAEDPGDIVFSNSTGVQKGRIWSSPASGAGLYLSSGDSSADISIDSAGMVGIGTSPHEKLEIAGNLRLPATTATTGIIKSGASTLIHTYGTNNFFAGIDAGNLTMTGSWNTASGTTALYSNVSGVSNTAIGFEALYSNTGGSYNTASGLYALRDNTTGYKNTAVGHYALIASNGVRNTAIGEGALSSNISGNANTAIGADADVLSDNLLNATAIGASALVDASNKVVIGNSSVTSIGGFAGWSNYSDQRVKTDIQDIGYGLDLIRNLRPVSFRMKNGNGNTDFGFIAQDIESLLGDEFNVLDIGGGEERMLSLRYTQFIAPMVKAMQEQQEIIESQQARIEELEQKLVKIEELKKIVEELRGRL